MNQFSIFYLAATSYHQAKKHLDELKNLDKDLLFDALKQKEFQDRDEFDEDDKAFMRGISKG